jgi:hypothetical protein
MYIRCGALMKPSEGREAMLCLKVEDLSRRPRKPPNLMSRSHTAAQLPREQAGP